MNRRHFLVTGLAAGLTGLFGCKNYLRNILNQIDLEEGILLLSSQNYVVESNTIVNYVMNNVKGGMNQKGMGIRYKDYYLTLGHIANFSKGIPTPTPFGIFNLVPDELKFHTEIKGEKLEKIIFDEENDLAIFKIPNKLSIPKFPFEPREEVFFGERIADIGNPKLMGFNCRIGRISDLDGIDSESYSNSIGTDIEVIPGDSGTPVISLSDKKLLGLMGLRFFGLSYFQPIKHFLKYL